MRIYLSRMIVIFFFAAAVLMFSTSPVAADNGKIPAKKIDPSGQQVLVVNATVPPIAAVNAKNFPPTIPLPKVLPTNQPTKYVKNPPGFCVPTWRCDDASPTEPKPGKGPKYGKGPGKG